MLVFEAQKVRNTTIDSCTYSLLIPHDKSQLLVGRGWLGVYTGKSLSQTLIFSSLYFPPNDVNFYISNYLIFPTIWYFQLCDISNYLIDQNSKLEISKVYNIGLQRYTWILKSEFIAKKKTQFLWRQRNWVFATNLNFLIPISLKPDGVNLWYV